MWSILTDVTQMHTVLEIEEDVLTLTNSSSTMVGCPDRNRVMLRVQSNLTIHT